MKLTRYFLFLFLLIVTTSGICQQVHYTRTGKKYHSTGCQYLRKSDFVCTLSEALSRGLSPCSRCHPPTQVEKETPAEKIKPRTSPKPPDNNKKKTRRLGYNPYSKEYFT